MLRRKGRDVADAAYRIDVQDNSKAGFQSATKNAEGFAGRTQGVFSRLNPTLVAGAAAAAVVGGGIALITSRVGRARELRNFAQLAQVNTTALQEWGLAAKRTGAEIDDVVDAVRESTLRIAEAAALQSGPAVDALNLLGVSLEDIVDLPAAERFELLRGRIAAVEDPAQRLFIAEELLGGSTERLQGFLALTSREMANLRQEAHDTGQVLSGETVDDLLELGTRFDELKERATGLFNDVIEGLAPAILDGLDLIEDTVIPKIVEVAESLGDGLKDAFSPGFFDSGKTADDLKEFEDNLRRQLFELNPAFQDRDPQGGRGAPDTGPRGGRGIPIIPAQGGPGAPFESWQATAWRVEQTRIFREAWEEIETGALSHWGTLRTIIDNEWSRATQTYNEAWVEIETGALSHWGRLRTITQGAQEEDEAGTVGWHDASALLNRQAWAEIEAGNTGTWGRMRDINTGAWEKIEAGTVGWWGRLSAINTEEWAKNEAGTVGWMGRVQERHAAAWAEIETGTSSWWGRLRAITSAGADRVLKETSRIPGAGAFAQGGTGVNESFSGFDPLGIPRFAQGGIVTRPTLALVGEEGPEAIVPLGRGGRRGGGDTYISIEVNAGTVVDPDALTDLVYSAVSQGTRDGSLEIA